MSSEKDLCAKCIWSKVSDGCHIAEAIRAVCLASGVEASVWRCPNFVEVKAQAP